MRGSRPRLRAASAVASRCSRDVASKATPTTLERGNASRAISTRLAASSSWRTKIPVTFLPGRERLEPISKSLEEDNEASELYEAEEVLGVVFPTDEDAALPLNPGEEALDEPASHVAA